MLGGCIGLLIGFTVFEFAEFIFDYAWYSKPNRKGNGHEEIPREHREIPGEIGESLRGNGENGRGFGESEWIGGRT